MMNYSPDSHKYPEQIDPLPPPNSHATGAGIAAAPMTAVEGPLAEQDPERDRSYLPLDVQIIRAVGAGVVAEEVATTVISDTQDSPAGQPSDSADGEPDSDNGQDTLQEDTPEEAESEPAEAGGDGPNDPPDDEPPAAGEAGEPDQPENHEPERTTSGLPRRTAEAPSVQEIPGLEERASTAWSAYQKALTSNAPPEEVERLHDQHQQAYATLERARAAGFSIAPEGDKDYTLLQAERSSASEVTTAAESPAKTSAERTKNFLSGLRRRGEAPSEPPTTGPEASKQAPDSEQPTADAEATGTNPDMQPEAGTLPSSQSDAPGLSRQHTDPIQYWQEHLEQAQQKLATIRQTERATGVVNAEQSGDAVGAVSEAKQRLAEAQGREVSPVTSNVTDEILSRIAEILRIEADAATPTNEAPPPDDEDPDNPQ